MIEGYLNDKWAPTDSISGINAHHPYKDSLPDFSEKNNGTDVTLYYGITDGGN